MVKKTLKWVAVLVLLLVVGLWLVDRALKARVAVPVTDSPHFQDGRFVNEKPMPIPGMGRTFGIMYRFITDAKVASEPGNPLPMHTVSLAQLETLPNDALYLVKLGHSSILLKVYGAYWLIDPVFSDRASPFGFVGPKRFQDTPIALIDLPPIDTVLISHNHYDHLDQATISHLAATTKTFCVPLGIEGDLQAWGVKPSQIQRFDWWQEAAFAQGLVAFVPAQHFSGRGLSDRNTTLWGGWVIQTDNERIYYSGDSGYFSGFKTIGAQYGPFDLTLIETGAYNERDWPDVHLTPEQSVQAHINLRGRVMLPVHNGTFDLAFHPWYEPMQRASAAAAKQGVTMTSPLVGQVFTAKQAPITTRWWE